MSQSKKIKKLIETVVSESQFDVEILYEPIVREGTVRCFETSNFPNIIAKMDELVGMNVSKYLLSYSMTMNLIKRFEAKSSFTLFSMPESDVLKVKSFFEAMGCLVDYKKK
jgi:hypothetical protein